MGSCRGILSGLLEQVAENEVQPGALSRLDSGFVIAADDAEHSVLLPGNPKHGQRRQNFGTIIPGISTQCEQGLGAYQLVVGEERRGKLPLGHRRTGNGQVFQRLIGVSPAQRRTRGPDGALRGDPAVAGPGDDGKERFGFGVGRVFNATDA